MPSWTRTLPLIASLGAACSGTAAAQTAPDQAGIWTIQAENDAVSTQKGTSDRYYTSGLRLGWTSGQDTVGVAAGLGQTIWGQGTTRLALEISQSIFTPANTQISPPDPNDRPYAADLLVTAGLVHENSFAQDFLSLSLGVLGPAALGRQVQNGFHDIIGDTPNRGWHDQLQNQPAFQILGQRTYRLPIVDFGPIETDALPSASAAIGDLRDYVQLGGVVRLGQGLASDFGTPRIEPGLNGTDAFTNVRPFAWYLFGGVDGQAVGYDVTLDGSTFRDGSRSVHRRWDVGEIVGGAAILWHGLRFSYTQTWQTQTFKGAKSGLFNFGSVAVSAKF